MQLEFHQLDRRWEHLRVHHPGRQRRLLGSLAESGQQTPIVVVAAEDQTDHFVVIDGYKRITALRQLGRDTVEAVVWPMSEAACRQSHSCPLRTIAWLGPREAPAQRTGSTRKTSL